LNDLIDHLSPYSSEEQGVICIEDFIKRFESLVSFTSTAAPISQSLLDLGVRTFREFTANDFRLLYQIKKEENSIKIIGDVIISQKQDIQQLLINYCLLHK
tara:strand:+ start:1494 stop:1796 length:303 start_codon:yes stop_codon:yes gene_type:complete